MENCTIYSHKLDFGSIKEYVEKEFPKAKLSSNSNGLNKSIVVDLKGGLFKKSQKITFNYRERKTPSYRLEEIDCGLTQNLAGMTNYIQSIPCENTEIKGLFLKKVQSANCEIAFVVEPELTLEIKTLLRKIVRHLDGFIFTNPSKNFQKSDVQHFLDKNLRLIIDAKGNNEVDELLVTVESKYHDQPVEEYMQDQLIRKANSEKVLRKLNLKVNENLPCIVSGMYVTLRDKNDVINRIYALLAIALKGEGLEQQKLDHLIEQRSIKFSDQEKHIIDKGELTQQERTNSTWRYEALYALLWSVGKFEQVKLPLEICSVQDVVQSIVSLPKDIFENSCSLRSKIEILNELDKTYRMHWSCVDAQLNEVDISNIIHPGIVYERHYALNWLIRDKNKSWDFVEVNT